MPVLEQDHTFRRRTAGRIRPFARLQPAKHPAGFTAASPGFVCQIERPSLNLKVAGIRKTEVHVEPFISLMSISADLVERAGLHLPQLVALSKKAPRIQIAVVQQMCVEEIADANGHAGFTRFATDVADGPRRCRQKPVRRVTCGGVSI